MKKTLAHILITLISIPIIIFSFGTHAANAENGEAEQTVTEETQEEDLSPTIPRPRTLPGPEGEDAGRELAETILPNLAVTLTGFASMAALLWLIISGVRFATAYGNEEKIENSKKQAMYSLIGLVLALLAYTIVVVITRLEIAGEATPTHLETEAEEEADEDEEDDDDNN